MGPLLRCRLRDLWSTLHRETGWGDWSAVFGQVTAAERALSQALNDPDDTKVIVGVVGFSLGANVVLNYYPSPSSDDVDIAFWAIEPFPPWDSPELCKAIRQCAGLYQFDVDWDAPIGFRKSWPFVEFDMPVDHDPHNSTESAREIIQAVDALTVDLVAGRR